MKTKHTVSFYLKWSFFALFGILVFFGQNIVKAQEGPVVLVVDAGVLPNSKLYFLDKFDEWVQENIFTFGVSSLRAEAALSNASERVSEARILNAQGLLSARLANKILLKWRQELFLATSILNSKMSRGENPVYSIQQTLSVIFSGKEAVSEEVRDSILLKSDDRSVLEEYLWETEEKTLSLIFDGEGINFDTSMETIAREQIYFAEKNISSRKKDLSTDIENGRVQFAGKEMIYLAENSLGQVKKFTENKDYKNALDAMADVRKAVHFSGMGALLFDESGSLGEPEILERVDKAEKMVIDSGLLDNEIVRSARKDLLTTLGVGA